jgi:uncharacterized protein involved in exopolysaccharide biosynthesis
MLRYLETFYRHRLVLLAPLLLCLAVSLGVVVAQPRTYESATKIWTDRSSLGQQTPENAYIPAAEAQSAVVRELLKTRSFCLKVASRGLLLQALAARPTSEGDGLLSRLLSLTHGRSSAGGSMEDQLNDLAYQIVSTQVKVEATGPQILSMTFRHGNPQVAQGTLQAVGDQFTDEILGSRRAQADAAVAFYNGQVKLAEAELLEADAKVYRYLAAHPDQQLPNAIADATLTQLRRTDDLARRRYESLLQKQDQARLDSAAASQAAPSGLRVIDQAQLPRRPVSLMKPLLAAGGGGLAVGLLLMLLGLLSLTLADMSVRRPEEVEPTLHLRVVGSVPRIK